VDLAVVLRAEEGVVDLSEVVEVGEEAF